MTVTSGRAGQLEADGVGAVATAVDSTDPAWRDDTVTLLSDVQEHVTTLGQRVEGMIEHLTWLRSAF